MAGLSLEDFHSEAPVSEAPAEPFYAPDQTASAAHAAAYEEGYRAGWDDAARSQSEEQAHIGAELARNLQEMSFTFHEARAHVIQSMEPLLAELVHSILPGLANDTFAQTVQDALRPLIADCADAPVELVVAAGSRALLEDRLAECAGGALKLLEEPSLAEGQAYLRVGKSERQIDLSGALARIQEAVAALYEINERTLKHG